MWNKTVTLMEKSRLSSASVELNGTLVKDRRIVNSQD